MNEAPVEQEAQSAAPAQQLSLAAHVEALLYASKEPATINALATALEVNTRDIEEALDQLAEQYAWRGIRLQRQSNKIQLVTAPEVAARVQKFLGMEEVNRLSTAALETLAIIAYNQPITKPQIEMIRGVNCDGVMNTLEARNLISELGRADTVGHPMRYGVSFEFLQYFGLKSTHELPPVSSLDQLPGDGQQKVLEAPEIPVVLEGQTEGAEIPKVLDLAEGHGITESHKALAAPEVAVAKVASDSVDSGDDSEEEFGESLDEKIGNAIASKDTDDDDEEEGEDEDEDEDDEEEEEGEDVDVDEDDED